jgi:uncharacterized protein (DUF697 family)
MSEATDAPAPAGDPPSADGQKAAEARKIIRNHAIASVASGLLLGVPLLSVGLLIGAHLLMIRKLAKVYEVEFSEQRAISIIGSLLGVGATGSVMGLLRLVPGVGALVALATPSASTYALGKVFTEHFESGGTFLTFDQDRAKERYQKALAEKTEEESYVGIKP